MERLTRLANNIPEKEKNRIAKYTYGHYEWMYSDTKEADAIQKLAAYEDAEEDGRLIVLPCKVGDIVYEIWYKPCHLGNDYPDSIDCDGCMDKCDLQKTVIERKAQSVSWIVQYLMGNSKMYFVSREEAEAAFSGMEEKDGIKTD